MHEVAQETEERAPRWAWSCGAFLSARDKRNLRRFNAWAFAWAFTWVLATLLIRRVLPEGSLWGWGLAVPPAILAIVAVRSYVAFLRDADELLRKIQVEALALGFGAGWVFAFSYRLAERLGAPKLDVTDVLLVMIVFWMLGQWLGQRRYS